ncbi:hypothetical protein H8356DRAFT_1357339 [Neocallimastix lanati (nom. inval.)]|nr:hypothetical protein H8356DRAFT_1357339 [Neocallimastix sp. JGI-2020a]
MIFPCYTRIVKINLYELAQWLIENGADIHLKSESELHFHHHSPFESPFKMKILNVIQCLLEYSIVLVCENNNFEIDWGKKKVMITVKREILKLKIGAVMFNKMNQIKPYSALQVSFDHHYYEIVEYLIEYEGDNNIIRSMFKKENLNMMRTFLHQQKHNQPFNINYIVKLLVENGTNSMVQMIVMVNQFRESATHISYRVILDPTPEIHRYILIMVIDDIMGNGSPSDALGQWRYMQTCNDVWRDDVALVCQYITLNSYICYGHNGRWIYKNGLLTSNRLNFMIKKYSDILYISSSLLKKLIIKNEIQLLNIIFGNFKFYGNDFIKMLLFQYKNKISTSLTSVNGIMSNDQYNISINHSTENFQDYFVKLCKDGKDNIIKYLIEHGADVNKANKFNMSPL